MTSERGRSWMPDPPSDADLVGWDLDPAWSRTLDVRSHDGATHRWHVLDTAPSVDSAAPRATIVCVHGNPTWAYAWATFLRTLGATHRVIAVDQLGMGYSERTDNRRYGTRIEDLDDVIAALDIDADVPLVLAAHDWGGAVAMGWAVDHAERVAGMVLCNTGIAVPDGRKAPSIIRLAASAPLRDLVCRRTPIFVAGTARLSGDRITSTDRAAFRAPYSTPAARAAISDFVGDIPLRAGRGHPSEPVLDDVAARLHTVDAPVLLAWGAADPVFDDDFAADLAGRFPNTVMHRWAGANHLVMAEADVAGTVATWLSDLTGPASDLTTDPAADQLPPDRPRSAIAEVEPLWAAIDRRRSDDTTAFVDMGADGASITWADFADRVDHVAAELRRRGLRAGDRVAMLTPPGIDLVTAVYGVWRAGGVTVIADRGLGLRGLGAAVRSTRPNWTIGPRPARLAAKLLRWAPRARAIDIDDLHDRTSSDPKQPGQELQTDSGPGSDDLAAILFTSGATGPAKGVRYRHRQLAAQRDALATLYDITDDDRLVAAFAPFALYGPALGIPTALPDCDVTKPGELTADALAAAVRSVGASLAFASPAAFANVVRTAHGVGSLRGVRLLMSAGAPVPSETLRALGAIAPDASIHTPYGMTEVLPVADIDLDGIETAESDEPAGGVCVGMPVPGADVRICTFTGTSVEGEQAVTEVDVGATGEIMIRSPWMSDGYLDLWATERHARPTLDDTLVWHRSGDVGHLDTQGRLWVEGRSIHEIHGIDGTITSVPVERTVESRLGLARVAAVGIGPHGNQQLVIVIEDPTSPAGLASTRVTHDVRDVLEHDVAAVLALPALPVDIRHNAKIDRTALARWADDVLAGRRAKAPK